MIFAVFVSPFTCV